MITLKSVLADLSENRINQIVETGLQAGSKCGGKSRSKKSHKNKSRSNKSRSRKSGNNGGGYSCGCHCGW